MRVPPHSVEAEQAVVGSLLLDNELIDEVTDILGVSDFYLRAHRLIFSAILSQRDQNESADIITISDLLRTQNKLHDVGGSSYIASLTETAVPNAQLVREYAVIVREKAHLRQLITTATEIMQGAYEASEVTKFCDEAESKILSLSVNRSTHFFRGMSEIGLKVMDQLENIFESNGKISGISSGLMDLDNILGGFQKTDMITLAGRPGSGKTALALSFADAAASKGIGVAFFSCEMGENQLYLRLLAKTARIDGWKMRTGQIQDRDFARIANAVATLDSRPLSIDETGGINTLELKARARRIFRQQNVGLIIVDYIQLLHGVGRFESRVRELSQITKDIKNLAKELSLPVIVLSQLNRKVEERSDKHPMLSDLAESGSIEQDSDVVIFLYREAMYSADARDDVEVIVAKHRNGPTGIAKLGYDLPQSRFFDLIEPSQVDDWQDM